jgi:aspartate racemase
MKRLGLIGGLGPDATLYYYRTLIDLSRMHLSPGCKRHPDQEIVIYQVNQDCCADDMESGRWEAVTERLVEAAVRLHAAGAEFAVIASNTPHMVFADVQRLAPIPLLSIVEATCKAVAGKGMKKVGLLATAITMQGGFYPEVFGRQGISLVVPGAAEQEQIHEKIITELVKGIIREETRQWLMEVARRMVRDDAIEGVILGCTELPLILTEEEPGLPFFNTSLIHARAAFDYSRSSLPVA